MRNEIRTTNLNLNKIYLSLLLLKFVAKFIINEKYEQVQKMEK